MNKLRAIIHLIMLAITPSLLAFPQNHLQHISIVNFESWTPPTTYDEILLMLDELESGEFEKKYSSAQLEQVNEYLITLAREGILPGEFEEEITLEEDIYELMNENNSTFQFDYFTSDEYMLIPATYNGYSNYDIVYCGSFSKSWKKTKKFLKRHKKEIIIGAVVIVAVGVIAIAVVAASSATAAAATAGAAAASSASSSGANSDKLESSKAEEKASSSGASNTSSTDTPILQSAMEKQIVSFKENIAREDFFELPKQGEALSIEETGRVLGSLFAHESFETLNSQVANYPHFFEEMQSVHASADFSLPQRAANDPLDFGYIEIDKKFSADQAFTFSIPEKEANFTALSHQMIAEEAVRSGYSQQAIDSFGKAIELNPTDPMLYLQRSAVYFDRKDYGRAFQDFEEYTLYKISEIGPFSSLEFSNGFLIGLSQGLYDSGEGVILFLADIITHPINTSIQMYEAISALATLAKNDEWGVIGEVLSPEIHQLVTKWDTLPSGERGELAGYAFGKHGADIAAPGAVAKVASKSVKSAKELASVMKNLQKAKGTLVLETAAEIGNGAKVAGILEAGQKTAILGEELGFTAKEMGQLQKAGKLEGALSNKLENTLSNPAMRESFELLDRAQEFLKPYKGFMSEIQCRELIHKTGVSTFPKPAGIPKKFRVKISDKGAGMEYVHPTNNHLRIRIMPGKPHSPFPHQQKPYVVQMKDGGALDKFGKTVAKKAPEAHIPFDEFVYRN